MRLSNSGHLETIIGGIEVTLPPPTGALLDSLVDRCETGLMLADAASVRKHLASLSQDDLWNTLCRYTPGAVDASVMSKQELIEYGVAHWRVPSYSTDPSICWPIITREFILFRGAYPGTGVNAYFRKTGTEGFNATGKDHLEAACRLMLMAKLGSETQVDPQPAATTLCALMRACDSAVIDGFEVDEFSGSDNLAALATNLRECLVPEPRGPFFRLEWCGGDESAVFAEQAVKFEDGATSFEITDIEGITHSIQLFAERPHLVQSDVALTKFHEEATDDRQ